MYKQLSDKYTGAESKIFPSEMYWSLSIGYNNVKYIRVVLTHIYFLVTNCCYVI